MTHGQQTAHSDMDVFLEGENAVAQIISRSVAREDSIQVFHPRAIGSAACKAHIQCDSIIMDRAQVRSIPEIGALHVDAQIIHEAAIGRINNDQLIKLMTFGLSEEEAEEVIINKKPGNSGYFYCPFYSSMIAPSGMGPTGGKMASMRRSASSSNSTSTD